MQENECNDAGFKLPPAMQFLIAGAIVLLALSAAVPACIRFAASARNGDRGDPQPDAQEQSTPDAKEKSP